MSPRGMESCGTSRSAWPIGNTLSSAAPPSSSRGMSFRKHALMQNAGNQNARGFGPEEDDVPSYLRYRIDKRDRARHHTDDRYRGQYGQFYLPEASGSLDAVAEVGWQMIKVHGDQCTTAGAGVLTLS